MHLLILHLNYSLSLPALPRSFPSTTVPLQSKHRAPQFQPFSIHLYYRGIELLFHQSATLDQGYFREKINLATNPWWTGPIRPSDPGNLSTGMGAPKHSESGCGGASAPAADENNKDNDSEPREGASTRRSRGRPPGSKNKPKPPIFVTRDRPNALRSHVMEVAGGADVADAIAQFARRRQRGVCVLSGAGTVSNVALRQSAAPGGVVALHGRFEILSLTGTLLPGPALPGTTGLTVYLGGGQGQVVGGSVPGALLAAGTVLVMASTFANATYETLPMEEGEDSPENGGGGIGLPLQMPGGVAALIPGAGGLPDPTALPIYHNMGLHNRDGGGHDAFAWARTRAPF